MTEIQYCEKSSIFRNIAIASIPVFHYDNKVSRKCLFVIESQPIVGMTEVYCENN
jgi:hypothetical protein